MKRNWFFGAAILVATFSISCLSAQNHIRNLDTNNNGIYEEGEVDPCREYVSGKAK